MDRYIKVDDVLNIIEAEKEQYRTHNLPDSASKVTLRKVGEAVLKSDAVEIVRCYECKYKRIYDGETKYYYCALEDRPNRQWSIDDWNYCCWGERKASDE